MKGIVLAGGAGSRLWPITRATSKQLLPVYDKPMIYYPISTLMLAGIRNILLITTPQDQPYFKNLLKNGNQFGIDISYAIQNKPEGLAQALIIGETFLDGESCLMILGDNIFYGVGLGEQLENSFPKKGAHIFTYEVADPTQYGVLNLDENRNPISVEEKPKNPRSHLAITGLYYFDNKASEIAKGITPSSRGELEITSVIDRYLINNQLGFTQLSRGTAWLDTGNAVSLHDATTYVRLIEERTGLKIGCIEEIAFRKGWISRQEIEKSSDWNSPSYMDYLKKLI